MKKYTYQAVVFYDEENDKYILSLYDMGLMEEGDTVEEVHEKCKKSLGLFLRCAKVFESEVPEASTFESVMQKYPKNLCILVETSI